MNRLKPFGEKSDKTFYLERPIGLKFLGAVDFLMKNRIIVVFGKRPKGVNHVSRIDIA